MPEQTERPSFAAIRQAECYDGIDERLRSGVPVRDIAAWVQENNGELTHLKRDSLVTILYDFRRDMKDVEVVAEIMPSYVNDARKRIASGLDELEELEKLYARQMDRIDSQIAIEKKIKFPNPRIVGEIKAAAEILKMRHTIKMDRGFDGGRDLGTMRVEAGIAADVAHKYGDGARRAIQNMESRGKALALFNLVADLADAEKDEEAASG